MVKARHIGFLGVMFVTFWFSWGTYNYFFDTTEPYVRILGIDDDQHYAGVVKYTLMSDKKAYINVWCDETQVIKDQYIVPTEEGDVYNFETSQFSNGKHRLKIKSRDTVFAKNTTYEEYNFYIDNRPLQVSFLDESDTILKVDQGRTLRLFFKSNKPLVSCEVNALSHVYTSVQESQNSNIYECFIPVDCQEQAKKQKLKLVCIDAVGNKVTHTKEFKIIAYPFKKEVLAINKNKIEEEKEIGKSPKEFEQKMVTISQNSPRKKLFKGAFCTPIDIQRITCEFGTIRTTQHKGRYMHKALDIVNTPKSVVWSTHDGVVVLKDRFADTGNTVVVDHGCGITSLFFHLDDFANIEVGQKIVQGNPVGKIGKTGYATGYHLHWEMRINNIAVDPMQWTIS